ncbi:hypothetical protein CYLTODRAFT_335046, partial [Cylindrobasidium torrendii FP15055 ss-10]
LRKSQLEGFNIPGTARKLIATLFADDTTVYLSAKDDFEQLQAILEEWCLASGARFNIQKTKVVPVGTREFRDEVVSSRRTNATSSRIPDEIEIVNEGESTRILGGWIGNNAEETVPWETIIAEIDERLENWEK